MEGGIFIRVRVVIDASKPLSRSQKTMLDDGINGWVYFKYERLPPKALYLNWHLPMYKVLGGGLGGKEFKLQD